MDLTKLPVIDNHCHLFDVNYKERDLAKILSLSLNNIPEDQLKSTLMYKKTINSLGKFLKVSGSEDEILAKRHEIMKKDYKKYVSDLFNEVNIEELIVDTGYKPADVSLNEFEKILPCGVKYMFRIETIIDELVEDKVDFNTSEDRFFEVIYREMKNKNVVALKSIIGYRTGLYIKKQSRSLLQKGNYSEKEFRDYFLLKTIEKAIEYDVPLQIHAAFGESNINMINNNPMLLKDVFDDEEYNKAKIVLVHGGYPYTFEASYLAAMYPNVYLDMSEMIPFVPLGVKKGIRDMFDMCPLNKIMYGSDGFVTPEIHYIGAQMVKHELGMLFDELVKSEILDEAFARKSAEDILFNTAKKIYKID